MSFLDAEEDQREMMDFLAKPSASVGNVPSTIRRWTPMLGKTVVHQNMRVKEERVSIMYSVLPTSIQNRLPPLPSIRKTVTTPVKAGGRYMSPPSSGSTTPISEAETAVVDVSRADEGDLSDAWALASGSSYGSSMSVASTPPPRSSGVDWRCGRQGMDLVVNAVQESKGQLRSDYNAPFERTAYVDGVAYLLKGLPRDLDKTEVTVLRRSMPDPLSEGLPGMAADYGEGADYMPKASAGRGGGSRNIVHNFLLFVLVYVLACIRWAAPYVLLFFSELMRYEREYKVSENVLGTTMAGFTVGLGAVRKMSDGIAGQVLAEAFDYTAEGVSGALKDFAREMGRNASPAGRSPNGRR